MTNPVALETCDLESLSVFLHKALAGPLPQADGQRRMAPQPRPGWKPNFLPEDGRPAAALLLLYPKGGVPNILLTVRTNLLPTHRGQVSLPGGGVGLGESHVDAALREANEEIGLENDAVQIVGKLSSLHIPVSGFIVHPIVAVAHDRPSLRPRAEEVAEILEVPLHELVAPGRMGIESRCIENHVFRIPYFVADDHKIWGATAMILSELLCVLGWPPVPQER